MILLQRLFWLLVLFGAVWAVRRLFSSGERPLQHSGRTGKVPDRGEGEMVRDRVCNTFLPRARALIVNDDNGQQFFCSERCKQTFLERKAG